jgi:cell division protein FtsW
MLTVTRQLLILVAAVIFLLGIVMIFSTTSAEILDLDSGRSTHQALVKQLLYAASGIALGWGVYTMGYRNLLAYSQPLLIIFTILLVMTLIPGIGREVNGSRRWIHFAGLSFQPSEFVKYLVPAFFIHKIMQYNDGDLSFKDFIKLVGYVSIPMILILVEPNNGTTAVVAMTLIMLFFITRIPFRYWAWPLIAFTCVVGVFASQLPYVAARINVYLHPELDLKGKGHQPYQAKIAAGSGQFLGKGPGNSLQKLSYLPEAQNDYIAAIYAEEFGFIGILTLIGLYLMLASCGFSIAHRACDQGGFYIAATATFLITFQAFLNMGVVIGLLPSTGLNLPLFSQGGSSLMANIVGLSLLLNVSRESQIATMRGSHG